MHVLSHFWENLSAMGVKADVWFFRFCCLVGLHFWVKKMGFWKEMGFFVVLRVFLKDFKALEGGFRAKVRFLGFGWLGG